MLLPIVELTSLCLGKGTVTWKKFKDVFTILSQWSEAHLLHLKSLDVRSLIPPADFLKLSR